MESRKNKKIKINLFFIIPLIILLIALSSFKDFFKFLLGNKAPEIVSLEISFPNPKIGSKVIVLTTVVDGDGDTLTYSWVLKTRPQNSESMLVASENLVFFIPLVPENAERVKVLRKSGGHPA